MSEPKLRFKNFNQALVNSPFERYIKSSKYGPRFDANDYDLNGNVKTIRGTDVALDATIKYEQVPIANLPQKLIDEHQLQEGDILMITTADCGLSAVFEKQEIPFIASAYAVRIVLNDSLDSLWVKYYLQTQHIINEVNKYVRKGTLSNLPLSDISKFSFTVPTLEEQTKIASFLSAVDEKISQLTQKHELLGQYKQGMMQKLFSQQIRFKADDGSEFGEWENTVLGDIADIVGGGTPSTNNEEYWSGDVVWLTPSEINQKFIGESKRTISELGVQKSSAKKLPIGTILFTSRATIGEVAIAIAEVTTNQGFQSFISNEKTFNEFLYYWIVNNKKSFIERASGSTFLEISKSKIQPMEISLPCLEEQTKIANFLSAIDQKLEVVAQQIEQAKQWKKGLLQQMFV